MPGSTTTPGDRVLAISRRAFVLPSAQLDSVGARDNILSRLNGWPHAFPYRRFADILADACARLGADVDRYPSS